MLVTFWGTKFLLKNTVYDDLKNLSISVGTCFILKILFLLRDIEVGK